MKRLVKKTTSLATDREPFHYSLDLEYALLDLFGAKSRWDNAAGAFRDPKFVKEALVAAAKRLRSRTRELITNDDRLLLTTSIAIDSFEREAKRLDAAGNNQLELIAALLKLVGHLLGYDWLRGEPNRQVLFFQTIDQQLADDRLSRSSHYLEESMAEFRKRLDVVARLHDEGLGPTQIARVLLMSEHLVKQLLVRSGKLHRSANIRGPVV